MKSRLPIDLKKISWSPVGIAGEADCVVTKTSVLSEQIAFIGSN